MKKRIIFYLFISSLTIISCSNEDDNYIEESGNIEVTNIILSSQSMGKVDQILADEGSEVNIGDTLLIVDYELLEIQLRQARAGQKAAQAKLDLATIGARSEDIRLANEKLIQAKTSFNTAEVDFERMKNLYSDKAITKKQYDDAESRYLIVKSQLSSANANLKKIKNISRPEEIAQLESNFENATANVALIKKKISDSHIVSPIDGYIVERFIELGENVNHGSSLFKISDLTSVELVVFINETKLGKIKLGQEAEVITDTFDDKVYKGKISYISPEAEFTPKNIQTKDERSKLVFAVKIELPNPNLELKAGIPADVKIRLNNSEE